MRVQRPASAAFGDQAARGIFCLLSVIDGKQLEPGAARHLRGRAGDNLKRQGIEIQRQLIAGHAFLLRARVGDNELGIPAQKRKISHPHEDATQFGATAQKLRQAELRPALPLLQQHQARVEADQIAAIPDAVVVALVGRSLVKPCVEMFVVEQVQFKMDVGAFLADAFGVAGAAP